ncbi:hypothetical protein ACI65C_013536 [Semiaphis heraclei]
MLNNSQIQIHHSNSPNTNQKFNNSQFNFYNFSGPVSSFKSSFECLEMVICCDRTNCNSDSEEDVHLTPPKKIIKNPTKHRAQKFRSEWLRVENLKKRLVPVDDDPLKAKCKLCNFTMVAELSNIKAHGNGKKHKQIEACKEIKQKSIKTFTTNKTPTKLDIDVKIAEIKLTAFLAEHNIAFLATDHLTDCFKDYIKKADTYEYQSVQSDIQFFDSKSGKIESKFWDLYKVYDSKNPGNATAEKLFNSLMESLTLYGIPKCNVIGFGSDGCNTMMGENNSVASRMKIEFPGIFIMKCVCHSAHLCASEACKRSSKRQCEFSQFQTFLNLDPHKILHPSQTRWLSLTAVVDRVIEQWDALRLYFLDTVLVQRLLSTEHILAALNDPFMKLFYYFLQWALPKFTSIPTYLLSIVYNLTNSFRQILLLLLICMKKLFHSTKSFYYDEWRRLPISISSLPDDIENMIEPDTFWWSIKKFSIENDTQEFIQLCNFALALLSLPHANADCERIFSSVNCMKTKIRSKLITETISGLLHAKQCIKGGSKSQNNCTNFEPTNAMLSRMTANSLYCKGEESLSDSNVEPTYQVSEMDYDEIVIG